ncbi:hypothetical protein [Candidatus Nitrosotalea okcheonensis]|uniref:Uncharacterized protein n=1 Tax=Candidatus Nitrosotalea okcheonensis TaxID=1903276 RepID=A0A2H1FEK9_9ARCH|nr:hypothetical protein [Candidatus Nitrosotalea okcheonensis]SMH71197.1 conserved protein of unknown function [Candidatus Nitrosotalea okcheonensis]
MSSEKTSTFTFRIDKEYEKVLREEAQTKKITVNALANQIFGDYVEWQRYMEKFGTIVLSREAFKIVLDSLDEKSLLNLAVDIGGKAPKEFILFKWKEIAIDNVIKFVKMYFDHCGYGTHDHTKTGGMITFSIRHDLGKKGSLFLKTFLETLIKSTLGKSCNSTVTTNSLVLSFQD